MERFIRSFIRLTTVYHSRFTFQYGEIHTDGYICYTLRVRPFTFQYGEIHTFVIPGEYVNLFIFTFQYGEIHTAVLPPFYAQIHLRRCCLCYNYAFDFQFFRKNQIFVCRSTGFLALLDIDRHSLCNNLHKITRFFTLIFPKKFFFESLLLATFKDNNRIRSYINRLF